MALGNFNIKKTFGTPASIVRTIMPGAKKGFINPRPPQRPGGG